MRKEGGKGKFQLLPALLSRRSRPAGCKQRGLTLSTLLRLDLVTHVVCQWQQSFSLTVAPTLQPGRNIAPAAPQRALRLLCVILDCQACVPDVKGCTMRCRCYVTGPFMCRGVMACMHIFIASCMHYRFHRSVHTVGLTRDPSCVMVFYPSRYIISLFSASSCMSVESKANKKLRQGNW